MRMVNGWRGAWRWWSIQALALQGAVGAAWLAVPDDMRAAVPAAWIAVAAIVLTTLGVAGRLIQQRGGDA